MPSLSAETNRNSRNLVFRLAEPEFRFHIRAWEGEAVVYDGLNGTTHYLDATTYAVFEHLSRTSETAGEIADMLASRFDLSSEEDIGNPIDFVLAELRRTGLIVSSDVENQRTAPP